MTIKNIFLLDADHFFANSLIGKINKRGNYHFYLFDSFAQAQAEMLQTIPDLILIEQNLKGETGIESIPKIQAVHPDCDIVMVSDQNDIEVVETAYKIGVAKYFRKDILLIDHIEGMILEKQNAKVEGWRKLFA